MFTSNVLITSEKKTTKLVRIQNYTEPNRIKFTKSGMYTEIVLQEKIIHNEENNKTNKSPTRNKEEKYLYTTNYKTLLKETTGDLNK